MSSTYSSIQRHRKDTSSSGSNTTPLTRRRRFDEGPAETGSAPQLDSNFVVPPTRHDDGTKRQPGRRKQRWSHGENKVADLLQMPTALTGHLTPEQAEAYAIYYRIEEISQQLRLGDIVPPEDERSPSPPPQYDSMGKRTNTRDARYTRQLEEERHRLIERAQRLIPNYRPPVDYHKPAKTQEVVYIPVNEYPDINFIGQLLGARGKTLKKMEQESGAKICIRGRGSVKQGKGRTDIPFQSTAEDDLHCLIISEDEEKIARAVQLVQQVIDTASSVPEGQNELKRSQLRELAALNGTLRDDENYGGAPQSSSGDEMDDRNKRRNNFMSSIVCHICGSKGHFARDCLEKGANTGTSENADREYDALMRELQGEGVIDASAQQQPIAQATNTNNVSKLPPAVTGSNAAPINMRKPMSERGGSFDRFDRGGFNQPNNQRENHQQQHHQQNMHNTNGNNFERYDRNFSNSSNSSPELPPWHRPTPPSQPAAPPWLRRDNYKKHDKASVQQSMQQSPWNRDTRQQQQQQHQPPVHHQTMFNNNQSPIGPPGMSSAGFGYGGAPAGAPGMSVPPGPPGLSNVPPPPPPPGVPGMDVDQPIRHPPPPPPE